MKLVKKGKICIVGVLLMLLTVELSGCIGAMVDTIASIDRRNPTYQEMVDFVLEDTTNYNYYDFLDYTCDDFAQDLIANARGKGYNAGYVSLDTSVDHPYYGTLYGHAIVCFDTTDKGLYFVEPQNDAMFSKEDMNYMISIDCYTVFGAGYDLRGYEVDWHHTTTHTGIPYWDY